MYPDKERVHISFEAEDRKELDMMMGDLAVKNDTDFNLNAS